MYSRVFTNEKCPCSGQVQQVTVYFEDTATNGIRDLNNYKLCFLHLSPSFLYA